MAAQMEVLTDNGDGEIVGEVAVEEVGVDAVGEHFFDLEDVGIGRWHIDSNNVNDA